MTAPKQPGKYIEAGREHDEDAFVYTLYSDGRWWRGETEISAAELPEAELLRVYAFNSDDRELLARSATTLAEHLNSWHGGPDQMYEEADQLEALAAHLSVDLTDSDAHLPGNAEGTEGKSKQWDQGYRVAYVNIIGLLRLTEHGDVADYLERVLESGG